MGTTPNAMTSIIFILIPITTPASISTLVLQRRHLLIALLALEGIILTLTLIIIMGSINELYFAIIILTFGACEARLGLSCLVAISRAFGNDNFKSISSISC